jgi:predicted metal-dependent hydrolase
MSVKEVDIEKIGKVKLYKRKGAKTMRLSISHDNLVKLTMPKWTPFSAGIIFVKNNEKWIEKHRTNSSKVLTNNLRLGKAHILKFQEENGINKISTRIIQNIILIRLPIGTDFNETIVQELATKACLRALKKEAESLLPKRLEELARKNDFVYKSIKIKRLKSRWGSCNNHKEITLNFYLMQLPWELIDYVILHELTHTKVLAHGPKFWEELEKYVPNAKIIKKEINNYKPVITTNQE